jgi:hypothetical protein
MGSRHKRTEPQSFEGFEQALAEEISVSAEFGLPLAALVLLADGEWGLDSVDKAVSALRVADLVARPGPAEISIALPNTGPEDAHVVERRLREAIPGARIGASDYKPGDKVPDLLARARQAAR